MGPESSGQRRWAGVIWFGVSLSTRGLRCLRFFFWGGGEGGGGWYSRYGGGGRGKGECVVCRGAIVDGVGCAWVLLEVVEVSLLARLG